MKKLQHQDKKNNEFIPTGNWLAYRKLFKYADVTKLAVVGPDEPTL